MEARFAACSRATPPESKALSLEARPTGVGRSFPLLFSFCPDRLCAQDRHTRDDSVVFLERIADDYAVRRDLVHPEFMAVIATTHFDYGYYSQELSFDLDIPLDDDLVGDE